MSVRKARVWAIRRVGVRYELETPGPATLLSPMAAMQRGARISTEVQCREPMNVSGRCIWPMLDGGKAPVQAPGQGCRTNETSKLEEKLPVVTH